MKSIKMNEYPEQRRDNIFMAVVLVISLILTVILVLIAPSAPNCVETGRSYTCADQTNMKGGS